MQILQSFNNGQRRSFIDAEMSDADAQSLLAIFPDGYSVREVARPASGAEVAKPVTGYTSLKLSLRKKINKAYSKPQILNLQFCKAETKYTDLETLKDALYDATEANKADLISVITYKEL